MNKIMKKLKIKGYEKSTIIKPRLNYKLKEIKDVQLSLHFEEINSINIKNEK
ncbi:hypothetical protein [Lysinibacillus sp. NPDC093692]|uniref:hypothetical protein n=1 Tax=Lysinibacillus sp. NPDC093692 TaxID=3390578 RepID=UPI003D00D773